MLAFWPAECCRRATGDHGEQSRHRAAGGRARSGGGRTVSAALAFDAGLCARAQQSRHRAACGRPRGRSGRRCTAGARTRRRLRERPLQPGQRADGARQAGGRGGGVPAGAAVECRSSVDAATTSAWRFDAQGPARRGASTAFGRATLPIDDVRASRIAISARRSPRAAPTREAPPPSNKRSRSPRPNAEKLLRPRQSCCRIRQLQPRDHRVRAAIRLRPDYAEAHNNLGIALASQGQMADAIRQWKEALRLKPDFQDPKVNLQRAGQAPRIRTEPRTSTFGRTSQVGPRTPHYPLSIDQPQPLDPEDVRVSPMRRFDGDKRRSVRL